MFLQLSELAIKEQLLKQTMEKSDFSFNHSGEDSL